MNFKSSLCAVSVVLLSACTTLNSSKDKSVALAGNLNQKLPFTCTATQGLQIADLPILTKEVPIGTFQNPLRLEAKPFDILFNGFVLGETLHLLIQADTKTFAQAVQVSYWGPYPTQKAGVEITRYAAKIRCVTKAASE